MNKEIQGVQIQGVEAKIALYTDDLVDILESPIDSIRQFHDLFESFGKISGYKVNDTKSIITGFNIVDTQKQEIISIMPAKYQLGNVRYLGIYICRTNELLMQHNIIPLIGYIKQKCKSWETLKLSWLGRISAVKMVLLPKLVFLIGSAIFDIPEYLLNKMQAIWKSSPPPY